MMQEYNNMLTKCNDHRNKRELGCYCFLVHFTFINEKNNYYKLQTLGANHCQPLKQTL